MSSHALTERLRSRGADDGGFTLIELVVTIAIVGIIAAGLTGVVISYLKHTVNTQARMTESHDVQFAAAYWQRDVASIGIRSATYDPDPADHTYPLEQSVWGSGGGASCLNAGDGNEVVTLGWSEYTDLDSSTPPTKITVSYLTKGSGPYTLTRVRCTGSTKNSTVEIADSLEAVPTIICRRADGGAQCDGVEENVPVAVQLRLQVLAPEGYGPPSYTATLTGERRQT